MRNVPPIAPDQNVYVLLRLNEKSKTWSRPAAPAMCSAALGETGIFTSNVTTTAMSAPTMRNICLTSTQVTAFTPPIIVYTTVGTPMRATAHPIEIPKTAEKTTAGAARIVPHDVARD